MDTRTAGKDRQPARFGEFLLARQAIDDGQHLDALAEHWASGVRFGVALSRLGYLAEAEVERLAVEFHALTPERVAERGSLG